MIIETTNNPICDHEEVFLKFKQNPDYFGCDCSCGKFIVRPKKEEEKNTAEKPR